MNKLSFAIAALVASVATIASSEAQTLILDRAVLNDYQYGYGGAAGSIAPGTDGENAFFMDLSNAEAGNEFPGGGSGGGDGSLLASVFDPTIEGRGEFFVSFDIEGFGSLGGDYEYGVELQFQDNDNSLGVTGENPFNAVIINLPGVTDAFASGATSYNFTVDSSASFARGSFADVATLVNTGELDNIGINVNAGQGIPFYGADADNGFQTRNVTVFQSVPEPSAALLLTAVLGCLVSSRRRA